MSAGFENAPITQFLSVLVVVLSTALKTSSVSLDLVKLMNGEIWRIFSSVLIFQNSAQMIVGLILLYTCRQFERQMGCKKFGAFLVFSCIVSTLVSIGITVTASSIGLYLVPSSGPFPIIFSLMMYYYWRIPKLHATQYSFAGLDLSEKSWIYLLAIQLMLSDGPPSIVAALSGLLVGYIYETDGYGFQNWRLPRFIEYVFEMLGGFFGALLPTTASAAATPALPRGGINTPNPIATRGTTGIGTTTRQNLMMDDLMYGNNTVRGINNPQTDGFFNDLQQFQPSNPHGDFGGNFQRHSHTPSPVIPPVPPSEENIQTLMGMGFERDAVVQALQNTQNNVEAAANSLLR